MSTTGEVESRAVGRLRPNWDREASMANPEHIEIVRQGVSAIRAWRKRTMPCDRLDLTQAVIDGAMLENVNLRGANLVGAYFASTVFRDQYLKGADVKGTLLSGADLRDAELFATLWRGVNLREADLTEAQCGWTVFSDINLARVKGLESVAHRGPSTIGWTALLVRKERSLRRFCAVVALAIGKSRRRSSPTPSCHQTRS